MRNSNLLFVLTLSFVLASCSYNSGRYQQAHDSTPTRLPTQAELRDPIPRFEPKSRGGNKKQYQVRGKSYQVLDSAHNFEQTGIASWYGNKFHGHLTSNGEIYDMYAMSAAHKNLPLPTYVRVTNLTNQKSVIVRVNDRGPFHQSRVIDLSYSAAYKLGMLKTGTAQVKIEAITQFDQQLDTQKITKQNTQNENKQAVKPSAKTQSAIYIQVFATRNAEVAENTATALASLYQQNVIFPENNGVYRVQMGPFDEQFDTSELVSTLKRSGYDSAYRRKILH